MKAKVPVFIVSMLAIAVVAMVVTDCCPNDVQFESFDSFVRDAFPRETASELNQTVDLYVDYSTCVAEAKTSEFYKATHPAIVNCDPNYYSIKGKDIKLETSNRNDVYKLLNAVTEVNNADLLQAITNITDADNQAVLITDGEYFPDNIVRDNLDNPYLAPAIKKWLNKGHDIYIYSEPYVESNRFAKFRYYMIFTDDDMDNNLNDKFVRNCPTVSDVQMLHLCSDAPKVEFSRDYPEINPTLSAVEHEEVEDCTLIDIQFPWKDMLEYMRTKDIEQDYFLRGIRLKNNDSDCYRIKEVVPVVYQLYDPYVEYADSLAVDGALPRFAKGAFKQVRDVFAVDRDALARDGEIILKIYDDFSERDLSFEHDNLFKIDFVVTDAKENFSDNDVLRNAFIWNSISKSNNHAPNTSLYQSIALVLREPRMNPKYDQKVVYSVYVKTPAYK